MDIRHTLQEMRIEAVLDKLGIESQSARETFVLQYERWRTNSRYLQGHSEAWRRLKQVSPEWTENLDPLIENEKVLRELDPSTASESQMEDWSQILFRGHFSFLNFIPFVLVYVVFSKIVIAPLVSWSMPLMTIILPYFALNFLYGMHVSWDQYWAMMKPMVFGSLQKPITISTLLQWGSMALSYGHAMYLPYTNAVHCYKIDQLMLKGSRAVTDTLKRLEAIQSSWEKYGLRRMWTLPKVESLGDERQVIAWLVEDKNLLPSIYRAIGIVEIAARIRQCPSLRPVDWIESETPVCKMVNAVDCLLEESARVPFTLVMRKGIHHAIITGPNRGGKSTFLRSTLTNLMLAHAWGVAFAEKCVLSPVDWIVSSLRLEDRPGEQSLFEREVSVAGDILRRGREKKTRGWVIIDELFHTTNPPDAETASQIFLRQLWSTEMTSSLVSTHLFRHAETAPESVQRLCVVSETDEKNPRRVVYTYTVAPGINRMSSVFELLLESKVLENESDAAVSWDTKTSAAELEDPNVE